MDPQRLAKAESEIENIKDDLKVVNHRLDKHSENIDSLDRKQQTLSSDLIAIRKDVESIDKGVTRVEATVNKTSEKLDMLKDQRVDDHLAKPLENHRKLWGQVIAIVIGLLTTFLLGLLFPMLIR